MWGAWFLIVIMLSPLFYWDLKVDIMCRYKQNGCHEILHYILHLTNGGLMRRPHQRPSCCNQQQSIQIKHFLSIPWKSEKVYYLTSKQKNSGQECLWFEYKHYHLPNITIRDKRSKSVRRGAKFGRKWAKELGHGTKSEQTTGTDTPMNTKLLIKAQFLSMRHICLQSHQSGCSAENNLMKYLHVFVEEEIWKTLSQFSDRWNMSGNMSHILPLPILLAKCIFW